MDCQTVQELISSFVDGELAEPHRTHMFEHLGTCRECQEFLHSVMNIRNAFAAERTVQVPPSVEESVTRTLSAKRFGRNVIPSIRVIIPVPVALAAAVLLVIGSLTFSPLFLAESGGKPPQSESVEVAPLPPETMQRIFSVLR